MNSALTFKAATQAVLGGALELAPTYPLSFAQQRLWFMEQFQPGSAAYNLPIAWRLQGPLDRAVFEKTLAEIVRRHGALRTTFAVVEGEPVQQVRPFKAFSVSLVDLSGMGGAEAHAQKLIAGLIAQPFDLAQGPLFTAHLFRLGPAEHIALFNAHHIVWDGWSIEVLRQEFTALYEAFSEGRPSPLSELPIQYTDFAVRQREAARSGDWNEHVEYWKRKLQGPLPALELPADGLPQRSAPGATEFCEFDDSLTKALRQLSRQSGATLFMTLTAAFKTLLHRHTGQEDVLVGSPIAGREQVETENLIGFFVNTLPLRANLSGDPLFAEVLQRVKEVTFGAYAHQDLPFDRMVQELQPERKAGDHSPLFSVVIGFESRTVKQWTMSGLRATFMELEARASKFDWTFLLEETDCGLRGRLEYKSDLFAANTIQRFLQHFRILLEGVAANPQRRISEYPLLTSEEQALLGEWNRTATDYERDACVHQLFEAQAEKTPEAVALAFGREEMTYRELNDRADELAGRLKAIGVGPEVLVGLCFERSLELMVAMLAILKAGGAYVPLDRTYPRERLQFMVADTGVTTLVTDAEFDATAFETVRQVIRLNGPDLSHSGQLPEESNSAASKSVPTAENLAYVMYTSGSTGAPKGVAIPHRGIVRLVRNTNYVTFSANDVFLQLAPVSFDASTFEIWGCLLNGGKLVIFPPRVPSLEELGAAIRQHGITTLWLTAGLFHQMVEHQLAGLQSVRQLLAGGDVLSVAQVARAARELPHCRIINGYGPTENTTFTTCFRVSADCSGCRSVPIGSPVSNTQLFVLDKNLALTPVGVPGELFIGGDGLARGYWNRPELTAEKFVTGPNGARVYRTGDIVRWRADGNLEFLGRKDSQVKIRGFRIELGEIEAVLARHTSVREAVVLAHDDPSGGKKLVAYVTPAKERGSENFDESALRNHLEAKLPGYMMPSRFISVPEMPLTANGKVDRRALAAWEAKPERRDVSAAPRTPVEAKLAEIWRDVLKVNEVGARDNFFHLGGHSLLAIQMISRIGKVFHADLPVRAIFETPTLAGLAEKIQQQAGAASVPRNGIARRLARDRAAQLLARLDKLSDAEVEALLRSSEVNPVVT